MTALLRLIWRVLTDRAGASLMEFGLALPLVFFMGAGGIEYANLARVHLLVSQITMNLADNASRVGLSSTLSNTQLRETDIVDVFTGTRLQGAGIGLTTYGRVTLSSLENIQQTYDTAPVQRIHWQRCVGVKAGTGFDSTYGTTSTTAGTDATLANAGTSAPTGMGDAGYKVTASSGSGVMFVEVNYTYQPMFGTIFIATQTLHYTASFMVRDRRDYAQIYNPAPMATVMTCDKHTA